MSEYELYIGNSDDASIVSETVVTESLLDDGVPGDGAPADSEDAGTGVKKPDLPTS